MQYLFTTDKRRYSFEEYLALDKKSEVKLDFYFGQVYERDSATIIGWEEEGNVNKPCEKSIEE